MKFALLIITAVMAMGATLMTVAFSHSCVGIMASTTYSVRSDTSILMLSLASGHQCQQGDWVFSLSNGYVGRVSAILGGMAVCEKRLMLGTVSFGDRFKIF